MDRIIQSPGKYIQGVDVLSRCGDYLKPMAQSWLVVGDKFVLGFAAETLRKSMTEAGLALEIAPFNGECSQNEIDRLKSIADQVGCQAVLGIGGGKTLDTAKALAWFIGVSVAIAPTIASTDAPCSALSVIYTDSGEFERYLLLLANPDCVMVDTKIIAGAPARLLAAGMGDALALERVVEANTYLSGVGFESGGLAAAHAIHNGLTAIAEAHHYYHGEKVAFGTLTQLMLENACMDEIETVTALCHRVGLPITLAQLDIKEAIPAKMRVVAQAACAQGETIHNMPENVSADQVYAALLVADQYGQRFLQEWQ